MISGDGMNNESQFFNKMMNNIICKRVNKNCRRVQTRWVVLAFCVFLYVSIWSAGAASGITSATPTAVRDEDGSVWYEISNANELFGFAELVNEGGENLKLNARLTQDVIIQTGIDLEGNITGEEDLVCWTPIGGQSRRYLGIFDGQGHSISGLYIGNQGVSSSEYYGFFGGLGVGSQKANRGTVRNLKLECMRYEISGEVTSQGIVKPVLGVGGIVGYNHSGVMDNVSVSGTINANALLVGGIAASSINTNANYKGTISNATVNAKLYSSSGVGGLVGSNNGNIIHCFVDGVVEGTSTDRLHSFTGGLVGSCGGNKITGGTYGLVMNSYSHAVVHTTDSGRYVGALTGAATGGYFINCYASGYSAAALGTIYSSGKSTNTNQPINNYYEETENLTDGTFDYRYYPITYNCYFVSGVQTLTEDNLEYDQVMGYTSAEFATGKVAYQLNHNLGSAAYQEFGVNVKSAYGQLLSGTLKDSTPVFLKEDSSNEVFRVTYQGDYTGEVYCNKTTTLPVCTLPGYFYQFTYANTDIVGETFDGTNVMEDTLVTVTKASDVPMKNSNDTFEISTAKQLIWFAEYVKGLHMLDGDDSDPTTANAVLLADVDLSDVNWEPIGKLKVSSAVNEDDYEKEKYKEAYKGHFDGQFHTITGLRVAGAEGTQVGLFGVTYGASIERLELQDVSVTGVRNVGGIVGYATGTKIVNCIVTGSVTGSKDYVGGIVGYAGTITRGNTSDYASKSYGTEVYRCFSGVTLTSDSAYASGAICGGTMASVTVNGIAAKATFANDYYDKDKSQAKGAVYSSVSPEGFVKMDAYDNPAKEVRGLSTDTIAMGGATWYLQEASMQQGDRNYKASEYVATDRDTGSDGITDWIYRNKALIWAQDITESKTPKFADGLSDVQKETQQIYRFAAINEVELYAEDGKPYEYFGNFGFEGKIPTGTAECVEQPVKEHYFAGWSFAKVGETGETLLKAPIIVEGNVCIYAYYNAEGQIFIEENNQDMTLEYGRVGQGEKLEVKATTTISKDPSILTYQWYETGDVPKKIDGEITGTYYIPTDLPVGEHYIFCSVKGPKEQTIFSKTVCVTITKATLKENLFASMEPQYYTGKALTPKPVVIGLNSESEVGTVTKTLLKETDYEISYENNINVTDETSMAKATIHALDEGNYKGSITIPFSIQYLPITEEMYEFIGKKDGEYFLDRVNVFAAEGYLLGRQLGGEYSSNGISYVLADGITEKETRLNFYLKDAVTGALTNQVTVVVKVKHETATTTTEEENTQVSTTTTASTMTTTQEQKPTESTTSINAITTTAAKPIVEDPSGLNAILDKPKVGEIYTVGNYQYIVTKSTLTQSEVKLLKMVKAKKKAVVPLHIQLGGYSFIVTEIAGKAFYGQKKVQKIVVGNNVTVIGSYAFANCKKCKNLIIKSKKLKKVGKNALKKTPRGIIIKVPKSCKKAYKKLLKSKGQKRMKFR